MTECGFCNLIQGKEVSQEYVTLDFNERYRNITHLSIWANNCLPWLKLSFDDREKVLQNNELYCKVCLRPLRPGTKGSSCGRGKHIQNTGFNGLCSIRECDRHSTLCRAHEEENKNRHKILKASLEWAQNIRPQQGGQTTSQTSFLMTMADESESRGEEELNDMNDARKEIHLKRGTDTTDIFGYINSDESGQVALVVVEDRRNNIAQFDLAYIDVDGQEILAAFDTCSSTTLIHRELIDEGKIEVKETKDNSNIKGIGGMA